MHLEVWSREDDHDLLCLRRHRRDANCKYAKPPYHVEKHAYARYRPKLIAYDAKSRNAGEQHTLLRTCFILPNTQLPIHTKANTVRKDARNMRVSQKVVCAEVLKHVLHAPGNLLSAANDPFKLAVGASTAG
eukprot:3995621-Amphidinium_carterae.1